MTGKKNNKLTEDTCIRSLPYSVVRYISSSLDIDKKWERLVMKIPKSLSELGNPDAEQRYSHLQVRLFENTSRRSDGSPTQAILDDWSTQNTKIKHLIKVLCDAALFEAADYLSVNVLHGDKVPRTQEPVSNPQQLPSPEWEPDNKPNNDKLKSSSNDQPMKLSEGEKGNVYGGQYYQLSNHRSDVPYNQLQVEVIYNRIPSYDSQPSVPVKDPNPMEVLPEQSKEDTFESSNTLQVRKVNNSVSSQGKQIEPVENTEYFTCGENEKGGNRAPVKLKLEDWEPKKEKAREPMEADEMSHDPNQSEVNDIYRLIGSQKINYELLHDITDGFSMIYGNKGGRLIGSGGFGDVFLGTFKNGYKVAIKKLKKLDNEEAEVEKQFRTELDSLIRFRHKNIVRLYGYSIDGPGKCLVYEYLSNGSLEDRLHKVNQTPPLPNNIRVSILQGTADGIAFLNEQGIIHRDIKSANVLLDEDFLPKVGDFATARGGPRGNETKAMSTQLVIGTSAYLAPEAMHFDVSTKLDSYSFGIIILEVLTSLWPVDHDREEKDIKSHVDENEVSQLLDTSGGKWPDKSVDVLLDISGKCTQHSKRRRCNVKDILSELHDVLV